MADTPMTSLPTTPDAGKVEAAREIFDEVRKALDTERLKRRTRAFKDCGAGQDTVRTLATDEKGRARFYARSVNSDDASLSFSYFFDPQARLRWTLVSGATEAGAMIEAQIGFDVDGARIHEEHKTVAGPAYRFPDAWPESDVVVKGPKELFSAANSCGELKDEPMAKKPAAKPSPKAIKK